MSNSQAYYSLTSRCFRLLVEIRRRAPAINGMGFKPEFQNQAHLYNEQTQADRVIQRNEQLTRQMLQSLPPHREYIENWLRLQPYALRPPMTELVALSSAKHSTLKVSQNCAMDLASMQHIINLRANEIAKAIASFPVFLTRHPTSGDFSLSIVTSLEPGSNLFVDNGSWVAAYEPVSLQTYPLFLMNTGSDKTTFTVGIDEANDAFSEDNGEALFDSGGKPSIYLSRITSLLEASVEDDIRTHFFVKALADEGLQKSVDVLVQYEDAAVQTIKGLYTVDEEKIQSLSAEKLAEFNKNGYLMSMYALLLSIFQMNDLVKRHNGQEGCSPVKQVKLQVARDVPEN